jgi:hypothetical protein
MEVTPLCRYIFQLQVSGTWDNSVFWSSWVVSGWHQEVPINTLFRLRPLESHARLPAPVFVSKGS